MNDAETIKRILARLEDEAFAEQGFIQPSPVRIGVWQSYIADSKETGFRRKSDALADILLVPDRDSSPGALAVALNDNLADKAELPWCVYNQSVVAATVDFETLVTRVLPLSAWWHDTIAPHINAIVALNSPRGSKARRKRLLADLSQPRAKGHESGLPHVVLWYIRLLGLIDAVLDGNLTLPLPAEEQYRRALPYLRHAEPGPQSSRRAPLFSVSQNRRTELCQEECVRTIKADAAREVFDIDCGDITWAVIDSGIDRRNRAFMTRDGNRSRIVRSVDFTRLSDMIRLASSPDEGDRGRLARDFGLTDTAVRTFAQHVRRGERVDWSGIESALTVAPGDDAYFSSLDSHGTEVAGTLGARAVPLPPDLQQQLGRSTGPAGVCPDIKLLDLRILRDRSGSTNTEFEVISALQYVRYLNRDRDKPFVNGVNLSISLPHDVREYACGQTPLCDECDKLSSTGVVVVAAAGNYGFSKLDVTGPATEGGYRDISITDPGNAESVITVGATHAKYPHRYGVSYFSSRGPTGDGRAKPDLVAPGEGVLCPSGDGRYEERSGTSVAAPHVSAAAALLMARHRGLLGDPARVKRVLCDNATDLGRVRDSQGHGLVDILRSIQSL